MKELHFYAGKIPKNIPQKKKANNFVELKDKLAHEVELHTTETTALNFDYLKKFKKIVIHNQSGNVFTCQIENWEVANHNRYVVINHNFPIGRELRFAHNLRKMWIAHLHKF